MSAFRLAILGVGGVGKSAITIQFIQHQFVTNYDPTITVEGTTCVLELMDTAGQEEYSVMRDSYMRTGQGFMLVYSIANRRSFEEIENFRTQTLRAKDVKNIPFVLVGNKCDLAKERKVTTEEGEALAKKWSASASHVPFLEASAKTRFHIDESFTELVRLVINHLSEEGNARTNSTTKKRKCALF
eukprot:TRINITY_DN9826_c0_g1_i2.p1 TRINITY_DN9826_c0_g1~~TRINITY_DN9826_c0_g1_i2.p1  ORF type:complete len:186 (+),score=12.73 TRINITY_DN9826_c0_g1_i2:88-645(+)